MYLNMFIIPKTMESLFVNMSICLFHVKFSSRWIPKKLNDNIFFFIFNINCKKRLRPCAVA